MVESIKKCFPLRSKMANYSDNFDVEKKSNSFSSDGDFSDHPLLDEESQSRQPRWNDLLQRLRSRTPFIKTSVTTLFFGLSLALLGASFVPGNLDRTCLKKLSGWCKFVWVLSGQTDER